MQAEQIRSIVLGVPGVRTAGQTLTRMGLLPQREPPREDRESLLRLLPTDGIGMEIGVHVGDFSSRLLERLRPRELHLVDPWEHVADPRYAKAWYGGGAKGGAAEMEARFTRVTTRFAPAIASGVVTIHRSGSHDALGRFPDAWFDWIYIDGDHTYEFVRRDLEDSLRKVKRGGVIAGDDYGRPGWWQDGVTRAVDEFVRERPVRDFRPVGGHQFIFRKP